MKAFGGVYLSILAIISLVSAATSWSFEDATLTIQAKGAGVGGGKSEKCVHPYDSHAMALLIDAT